MSKSAIYVVNQSTQDVAVDGIINLGTIVRRYGPNLNLAGNAIQISGAGYYEVKVSATIAPTAEGEVTITGYLDNVAVQGATATETAAAAGDFVNLSLSFITRQPCRCCEALENLTFVLTGTAANVTNMAVVVEKL